MTTVHHLDPLFESPAPALPPSQAPALGQCHIWATRRDDNAEKWWGLLHGEEAAKAARSQDRVVRETFVTSRGLQRLVGAHYLRTDPVDVTVSRTCRDCGSPEHGRPHWVGADAIDYSVAHSGEWVAVAVVGHGLVGMDIERRDAIRDIDDLALTVCTPAELAEYQSLSVQARVDWLYWLWVRKEAVLKLSGEGIALGLDAVDVRGTLAEPTAGGTIAPHVLHLRDVPWLEGYRAALASTHAVERLITYQVPDVSAG